MIKRSGQVILSTEEYKDLVYERDFYKLRVESLERNKKKFPEPYLTLVCNILANGKGNSTEKVKLS